MRVELLACMGDDLMVVNSARVSFNNRKTELDEKDKKLIAYLAKHQHWSPFSHPQIQFEIEAPVFVARQLAKHQVGFSWNEVSRRYVDYEPVFHTPVWRVRSKDKKQGSGGILNKEYAYKANSIYFELTQYINKAYKDLLELNVAPEQARMILPQSMHTKWIWTGSLYAFARMCKLRLKEDTQAETREIAKMIADSIYMKFPVSWEALTQPLI